jgi:hypothetical protein
MNIELHIDDLVLHGFAYSDRYLISKAIEHELARLFVERGSPSLLAESGDFPRLDAGAFEVAPGTKPAAIGAQVAQAVYTGLQGRQ